MIHFDIFTLFPGMFDGLFADSILKRAQEAGVLSVALHNIRDYAEGRHRVTDDTPYGGGGGMVMKPEPICRAVETVLNQAPGWRFEPASFEPAPEEPPRSATRRAGADPAAGRADHLAYTPGPHLHPEGR